MRPLVRNIIRYVSLFREAVILLTAVVFFSVVTGMLVYSSFESSVAINDNGKVVLAKTMKYTVKEVLSQKGVIVRPQDEISVALDGKLQKTTVNDVYIKRAVPLTITVDDKEQKIFSSKKSVFEALKNSGLTFSIYDRILGAGMTDKVYDGMNLKLVRVTEKTVTAKENIPFETIRKESRELAMGEEKVVKKGTEGIKENTFRVLMENGKEIAKQVLKECIITAPVSGIVEYGNGLTHRASRGGVFRYEKVLSMRTTAYTASFKDTGKSPGHPQFGITATGVRAKKGMVAVDPRVIPLGTRLFVEIAGDVPDYGYCVAADTGGAIKGDIIDLYFDDESTVDKWGCKKAKVYILSE